VLWLVFGGGFFFVGVFGVGVGLAGAAGLTAASHQLLSVFFLFRFPCRFPHYPHFRLRVTSAAHHPFRHPWAAICRIREK